MINCKKCGQETGPAFGLCSACIRQEDAYSIEIWADTTQDLDSLAYTDHFYIKRSDEPHVRHYYHWDMLLLWHDVEIVNANRVVIH